MLVPSQPYAVVILILVRNTILNGMTLWPSGGAVGARNIETV